MHLEVVKSGKFKNNFVQISGVEGIDYVDLQSHFRKRVNNWFILQQKNKSIPVEQNFMNEFNIIPIGLWKEAVNFAEKKEIQLTFDRDFPDQISDNSVTEESFTEDILDMFDSAFNDKGDPFCPFDYQIKAAYQLVKHKKCVIEVSTSGGKTLISYILFKWLLKTKRINNMLMFVPNTTLIKQTFNAFLEYDSYLTNKDWIFEFGIQTAGGGSKYKPDEKSKAEVPNIVIGTYQTISKFKKNWFEFQDCILGDEIQHITASSVQKIYSYSTNASYKLGVSGTVHRKNEYNYFLTQGFIGPIVYTLSSNQLISDEKRATPVLVLAQKLNYSSTDQEALEYFYNARLRKPPGDIQISGLIYNQEREYIRKSETRFNYVIEQIRRTKKNALVLFSDIKGGYGKRIYDELFKTTTKDLYYIDGTTPANTRTGFLASFEADENENSIIIASIGVFSEGIDLKRLWNIYLIEPLKSEFILAQILGRGMRRFPGKEAVILLDFQDSLDWPYITDDAKGKQSYMTKHASERNRIYKQRKFPVRKEEIIL